MNCCIFSLLQWLPQRLFITSVDIININQVQHSLSTVLLTDAADVPTAPTVSTQASKSRAIQPCVSQLFVCLQKPYLFEAFHQCSVIRRNNWRTSYATTNRFPSKHIFDREEQNLSLTSVFLASCQHWMTCIFRSPTFAMHILMPRLWTTEYATAHSALLQNSVFRTTNMIAGKAFPGTKAWKRKTRCCTQQYTLVHLMLYGTPSAQVQFEEIRKA